METGTDIFTSECDPDVTTTAHWVPVVEELCITTYAPGHDGWSRIHLVREDAIAMARAILGIADVVVGWDQLAAGARADAEVRSLLSA